MPGCGSALFAHGDKDVSKLGENDLNTGEQFQLSDEAAERYERCPARYILGPWAPLLVNAARPTAGERVLDVACGTGVVARIAAERVGPSGRVIGVDLNPGMIRVARSLPAPIGAPIEWLERSALDLRLEDASFDVVLCQQGLQFFPDKALGVVAIDFTPFIEEAVFDELDKRVAGGDQTFDSLDDIAAYLRKRYPLLPEDAVMRRARYGSWFLQAIRPSKQCRRSRGCSNRMMS